MQKKIIYIFQNCFWGRDVKTSGGDVRFCSIFNFIEKVFDEKSFIFTNKEGIEFNKKFNLRLNHVKTPDIFDKFGIYLSYLSRTIFVYFKILFLEKNDIFYSLSDFFPDVIPPFLLKNKNNRWIQVIHHIYLPPFRRDGNFIKNCIAYYFQKFSFLLIKKRATKVIVVNSLVKDELLKYGFDGDKINVSSNAIDTEYFNKFDKDIITIYDGVFIGRLNKVKGIFDLIEIWKNVNINNNNFKLAIIGGGDKKIISDLNYIIEKNNLSNNIFVLGYVENEKAYPILKSSKIFLFPSHEEGWGIAIAEAMACGLPVVAWNLSVYKNIFDNYISQIEENNINLFSEEVVFLLNNEEIRSQRGRDGCDFIKKYRWEEVAKNELDIILK